MSPAPEDIPVADLGLQPERTALSWVRTALAMLVCSMTLLRWSQPHPGIVFSAIVVLLLLAIAVIVLSRRIYRSRANGLARGQVPPNLTGVMLVTMMLVFFGAVALVLLVLES